MGTARSSCVSPRETIRTPPPSITRLGSAASFRNCRSDPQPRSRGLRGMPIIVPKDGGHDSEVLVCLLSAAIRETRASTLRSRGWTRASAGCRGYDHFFFPIWLSSFTSTKTAIRNLVLAFIGTLGYHSSDRNIGTAIFQFGSSPSAGDAGSSRVLHCRRLIRL